MVHAENDRFIRWMFFQARQSREATSGFPISSRCILVKTSVGMPKRESSSCPQSEFYTVLMWFFRYK